jgi:hypothetical protein
MTTTKRSRVQPQPRERPDDELEQDPGETAHPRRPKPGAPKLAEAPEPEPPGMGIGLDERGEIDRRFEP